MREALDVVYRYNLCTYYLLPLIGLNKFSFEVNINFKNCYVNREGTELTVEVEFLLQRLENSKHLLSTSYKDGSCFYVFELPVKWQDDFIKYTKGSYTKFSAEAKELIFQQSGLRYKQLDQNSRITTDLRLLAIDDEIQRRNILRTKLMEYYGVYIEEQAELLSQPAEGSYTDTIQSLTAK